VKILPSSILIFNLFLFWSCSDYGQGPLTNANESDCAQGIDCNISYSQVQEIFDNHCTDCHTSSHSTGLDLQTYAGTIAGGNSGSVINDDHTNSKLWIIINNGSMPPSGYLTSEEINLIATWIDEGATVN
tara:strand:- start:49 stop:438 length:390 start_codon:yes stop_codon:yes gene_type:complete